MLSQPFLFTASTDERKQVRDLLNRFARAVAKENGLEDKACTCLVRKFVNRQSKPKTMTAYKQFMLDNNAEINEVTNSFTEFNEEKTRRWNVVKGDADKLAEYQQRATAFNEEHGLLKKKNKRPLTGYMLFSQDQRPLIKEEDPSLGLSEVSKRIGSLWNGLSVEDKDVWVQKSKALATGSSDGADTTPTPAPKKTKKTKKAKKTKVSAE